MAEQHRGERVAEPLDEDLSGGIVCHVNIQTYAREGHRIETLPAWGLIDYDNFILLHTEHRAVWDEIGYEGKPVVLIPSEMESVSHACGHEPEEVQVALAKFRLTGKVEPICSE